MKHLPQNGYTKKKMMDVIRSEFRGVSKGPDSCMFRNGHGKKCSVGCFIPDQVYLPAMEGSEISELMDRSKTLSSLLPLSREGMTDLQDVHDYDAYKLPENEAREVILNWINNNVLEDL